MKLQKVFIIPYFGKFPEYFLLFLKSCGKNKGFNWLIFTDIIYTFEVPDNVRFIQISFEDLVNLIQNKFDFPIYLKAPYKLCDFKPAYGYIFEEYLTGYDFWGYCDCDLIFGDLDKFIPDLKLIKYDKIGHLGHLTLYRNTIQINREFMSRIEGIERYKEVFSSSRNLLFDEWGLLSINRIFLHNNHKVLLLDDFFDIETYNENFHRTSFEIKSIEGPGFSWRIDKKISYASWEDGNVYRWYKNGTRWTKEEVMYVHFQKRKMQVTAGIEEYSKFLCVPNKFVPYKDNIPFKYIVKSYFLTLINKKYWLHEYQRIRYLIIEKTGPIRHWVRRKHS